MTDGPKTESGWIIVLELAVNSVEKHLKGAVAHYLEFQKHLRNAEKLFDQIGKSQQPTAVAFTAVERALNKAIQHQANAYLEARAATDSIDQVPQVPNEFSSGREIRRLRIALKGHAAEAEEHKVEIAQDDSRVDSLRESLTTSSNAFVSEQAKALDPGGDFSL